MIVNRAIKELAEVANVDSEEKVVGEVIDGIIFHTEEDVMELK